MILLHYFNNVYIVLEIPANAIYSSKVLKTFIDKFATIISKDKF